MSLRSEIRLEQICFFHTGLLLFCQGTDDYLLTNEAKEILKLVTDEINQQFEDLNCDETNIINPMNHIDPYC